MTSESLQQLWDKHFPDVSLTDPLKASFFSRWMMSSLEALTLAMQKAARWKQSKRNADPYTTCKILTTQLRLIREAEDKKNLETRRVERNWRDSWTDAPLVLSGNQYLLDHERD